MGLGRFSRLSLVLSLGASLCARASADSSIAASVNDDLLARIAARIDGLKGDWPHLRRFDRKKVISGNQLLYVNGISQVANPEYERLLREDPAALRRPPNALHANVTPTIDRYDPQDGISLRIEIISNAELIQRVPLAHAFIGKDLFEVEIRGAPAPLRRALVGAIDEELARTVGARIVGESDCESAPLRLRLEVERVLLRLKLINCSSQPAHYLVSDRMQPFELILTNDKSARVPSSDVRAVESFDSAAPKPTIQTLAPRSEVVLRESGFHYLVKEIGSDYLFQWRPFYYSRIEPGRYHARVVWKSSEGFRGTLESNTVELRLPIPGER
jgi:hypothetical protein